MPITVTTERRTYPAGTSVVTVATVSAQASASALVPTVIVGTGAQAPRWLGWVGDSLTVGTGTANIRTSMSDLGFNTSTLDIDGLVGRSIWENASPWPSPGAGDVVNAWRAAGKHPNLWLIALCSNDFDQGKTGFKARANSLLSVLDNETITKVLWVGPVVRPGSTLQASVDAVMYPGLNEVAAERAATIDIRVFNLQTALRALALNEESPPLWTDDRHMTPAGYALRQQLIHDFIASHLAVAITSGWGASWGASWGG